MSNPSPHIQALVAAAGMGRRFRGNSPKQLVRIGGRSMLAAVVDVLEASRISGVVVVVNPNIVGAIRAERPETSRRAYVVNNFPEGQMIESVQMGIRKAFERRAASGDRPAILITPGDHPNITPKAIDACIAALAENPEAIVIASCSGRRGHPIILPADVAAEVLDWPASEPLNRVRERYAGRVLLADAGEPGILVDIDTREDLDRARLREGQ